MEFTRKWSAIALLNLLVLASVGLLLRYKILYPLPFIDHKHLLHGHSHFAFAGWVSLAIYSIYVHLLKPDPIVLEKYNRIFQLHLFCSYGMLFTFPFMGYALPSIAFSTLSIFISWWFCYVTWKELKKFRLNSTVRKWMRAALLFNIISSLGTFALAYMMATKNLHQQWYFGSVYFYLHFQYNGWFLFSILGFFFATLGNVITYTQKIMAHRMYNVLIYTIVPAWFLSMLWMRVPNWMKITAITAGIVQLWFIVILLSRWQVLKPVLNTRLTNAAKLLIGLSAIALLLKLFLQAVSGIPQLNQYAFGIRPIVIGFLHLVLLGFVTLFLIGCFVQLHLLSLNNQFSKTGIGIFLTGLLLNEITLMLQGVAAIQFNSIPYSNQILLLAAILMFTGIALIVISRFRTKTV